MSRIVSDIVDTNLFRKINARTKFLVVRRRSESDAVDIWQSIHTKVLPSETALDAARRDVEQTTGIVPIRFFTADYIGQFYDAITDTIALAPTLAAQVGEKSRVTVSSEYSDYAWCDLEETTARLRWSAHRWAVRHIYDVIAMGGDEAEMYAI